MFHISNEANSIFNLICTTAQFGIVLFFYWVVRQMDKHFDEIKKFYYEKTEAGRREMEDGP